LSVYLDAPLPDEMLFSVITRYVQESRIGDTGRFLRFLMGPLRTTERGLHLEHLAAQTEAAWGMDARAIEASLTLAPFYSTALGQNGKSAGELPYLRCAQWTGYLERVRPGLRFCQSCWRQDDKMNHPRYWRRSHQLPGVVTCIWHVDILRIAGAPTARRLLNIDTQSDMGHPAIDGSASEQVAWRAVSILAGQLLRGEHPWKGISNSSVCFEYAARCGYGCGTSLDVARMSRDLTTRLGRPFMQAMGLAYHNATWLRRAFFPPTCGSFQSVPTLLVAFLLMDNSARLANSGFAVCPGAKSKHDEDHRVAKKNMRDGTPHYFCSCGFSFIWQRVPGDDGALVPTQTGPDISVAVAILASRGYSVEKIANSLALDVCDVEMKIRYGIEVRPWHRQTVRARHLASWIQLVHQLGDANLAFQRDARLWRRVAPLVDGLPEAMLPELDE
jgi:hypothetical protein